MAITHWVAALAALAAGALFLRVGWTMSHRAPLEGEPARALKAFTTWWLAIGASTILTAGLLIGGALDNLALAFAARWTALALTAVALWGLLTYIAFIYRGDHRATVPLAVGYGLAFLVGLGAAIVSGPARLVVKAWTAEVLPADTPLMNGVTLLLVLAFLLPPIVAGVLLLRLRAGTTDPAQRRRLVAVGVGVPAWALASLVARLSHADLWQVLTRVVLGVVVALIIARAYTRDVSRPANTVDEGFEARVRELV